MIEKVDNFILENSEKWIESPRKEYFGGRSLRTQKFKVENNPSKERIIFEFEGVYLFCWNDVLKNDPYTLLESLAENYRDLDWMRNAEVQIHDNGRIDIISKNNNSAKIKLNNKKNKVILETMGRNYYLTVENAGEKLNIHKRTKLPLQRWRFIKAIEFLKINKDFVEIGARIKEDYSENSLEGYLKDLAKEKSGKITDTKTAPHIVDLLVLSRIAELGYATSKKGRDVQGVKLKI